MSVVPDRVLARISKAKYDPSNGIFSRGQVKGTGFVTIFPWLVTCNHVVAACMAAKRATDQLATGVVDALVVDFPFRSDMGNKLFKANVCVSKPKMNEPGLDAVEDIALVKLEPVGEFETFSAFNNYLVPLKIEHDNQTYVGHDVMIKGLHIEKGDDLHGKSTTVCADGRIKLQLEDVKDNIGGASGAPVWSKDEHAVIGMLASQRSEDAERFPADRVYMIPMYKIIEACDEHKFALLSFKQEQRDFRASEYDSFREDTVDEITNVFESSEPLRNALLNKMGWDKSLSPGGTSRKIVEECENNITKVFRNISTVVRNTLSRFEREEQYRQAKYLIEDAERIISSLSLFSIKKTDAEKLRQGVLYSSSSLNLTIPHDNPGSAEIVSSTRMQSIPRFIVNKSRPVVQGKHAVCYIKLECGIGKDDSFIDEIGKKVWIKVFPTYSPETYNRKTLREHIKAELKADDAEKKNYHLVVSLNPADKHLSPLSDKTARSKFTEAIPELPIIILDNASGTGAYVTSDRQLMVELYKFYETINEYDSRKQDRHPEETSS